MEHAFDLLVGHLEQYKHFTYLVIYLILVVSGAGLPIPEEAAGGWGRGSFGIRCFAGP